MSEELQSLVQIIELYGRGLEGLGKAIRFSACLLYTSDAADE